MNINFVHVSDVVAHRERKLIDLSAVSAWLYMFLRHRKQIDL